MDRSARAARCNPKASTARISGAQTVGRAIEVLCAVAKCQRIGATLARIMSETTLSRSTTFRLLHYLADSRLLDFDEDRRCYSVGPLAYELGLAARTHADLVANWKDRLERISSVTGKTAYLVTRSDQEGVCLATVHAPSVVRCVPVLIGQRLPLGIGAASLAILASLPDVEVDAIIAELSSKIRSYNDGRLTPMLLRQFVAKARLKGYAFSQSNLTAGIVAVGVRVPGDGHSPQLAVGVSAIATHMSDAEQTQIARSIRNVVCG